MNQGLRLQKLHGLGNDFLVALVDELPDDAAAARTAAALCHRRRGIGADGLIFAVLDQHDSGPERSAVMPPSGLGAGLGPHDPGSERSAVMHLWNSDGSAAEVSGNGLRCLAHAVAKDLGVESLDIVVRTVVGPRLCSIRPTEAPDTVTGTSEMGSPGPGPRPDTPGASPAEAVERILGRGEVRRWGSVDVGNPHAVLAVADPAAVPLREAGPAVEALFSGGINVHFAALTGADQLTLSVWERGAGTTEACGTGAVAAAAAFRRWGEVGQNVTVRMAGGDARVDLSVPVRLTGESVHIASASVDAVTVAQLL